jgi:prepilin peptidase CpaA
MKGIIIHAPAAEVATVTTVAFAVAMVVAAVVDLKSRRIPNALTISALVAGLLLRAPLGLEAVGVGILGAGLGLVLSGPFFLAGALGGGDVKLIGAVGAFMGPGRLIGACLLIALIGGVVALLDAARRGVLRIALMNVVLLVVGWLSRGRSQPPPTLDSPSAMTIPYGVPIAMGALAWWFWGGNLV